MFPRGALICFEGLDRSGKTTQAQLLLEHLRKHSRVELWRFPDRQTPIGALIQRDDRVVHLLFSANRWEKMHDMMDKLKAGTTILVDRYAAKNIVNAPLAWCQGADTGLISPDLVIFLELSAAGATGRAGYGNERYENPQFQEQVRQILHAGLHFLQTRTATWFQPKYNSWWRPPWTM